MSWYHIQAAADTGPAELSIMGDIGESWFGEESITAKSITAELKPLSGRPLTVRLNSYGGSVADGLAIYNALRRHAQSAPVTTTVEGVAMSIASLIAMAGDRREMAENALLMLHAPWGQTSGNAKNMRDMAAVLDKYAEAMTSAYTRSALTFEEVKALLTDGEDHFYSAAEAEAHGFITHITGESAAPIAARYRQNRFTQAAAPASHTTESPMTTETKPAAAHNPPADDSNIVQIAEAAAKKERERIAARAVEIRARFKPFLEQPAVAALLDQCLDDVGLPLEDVSAKLLAELGKDKSSIQGNPTPGVDAADKFRAGVSAVLAARLGLEQEDRSNEFRGKSLTDLAALSLEVKGVSTKGMTRSEISGRVLASHSRSDFPLLLADVANKQLVAAYGAFPSIWEKIAAVGSVSDFKTINLVKLGSFSSLSLKPEGGEYTQGTMSEEREQITARTKGKFIQCTREMLINDDLGAFGRMAAMLGRAAARTVNADVLAVLTANGATADGFNLFSTDHANYTTSSGTAISIASLSLGRKMMRVLKDPSGLDYLNLQPRYLLTPVGKEDHAREVTLSSYNTDTTAQLKRNPIQDWAPLEVLSDPILDAASTTAWYLIADPMDTPLLEVRFLDGQRVPYIAQEEEFLTDAIRWKVRLDYGVGVNEWRAGYLNTGA
jgi:ATP-dependent protease ClpP protease subunit